MELKEFLVEIGKSSPGNTIITYLKSPTFSIIIALFLGIYALRSRYSYLISYILLFLLLFLFEFSIRNFNLYNFTVATIIAFFSAFIVEIMTRESKTKTKRGIKFDYPNIINKDSVISTNKEVKNLIAQNCSPLKTVRLEKFFLGIENTTNKTIRNAHIICDYAQTPGISFFLNFSLNVKDKNITHVDIPPGKTEYFLFFHGYTQNDDRGLFHPEFISEDKINDILKNINYMGLFITGSNIMQPILRNDRNIVEVTAYADDVKPCKAYIVINAKTKIRIYLYEKGLNLSYAMWKFSMKTKKLKLNLRRFWFKISSALKNVSE